MTIPPELDTPRAGLSFMEEARLLAALRLPLEGADDLLGPALPAFHASSSLPVRNAAVAALEADLIDAPLAPNRHPEWIAAERAALPKGLRDVSRVPWLEASRPLLSGRLRRSRCEVGHLALLPAGWRDRVLDDATEQALGLLVQSLGARERLTLLAALGRSGTDELRRMGAAAARQRTETLPMATLDCFRTGFSRAAKRARDPAHFRARFTSFLVAVALGDRFSVELRALAESFPRGDGDRLLRYAVRERYAWGGVAQTALDLVIDAIGRTERP